MLVLQQKKEEEEEQREKHIHNNLIILFFKVDIHFQHTNINKKRKTVFAYLRKYRWNSTRKYYKKKKIDKCEREIHLHNEIGDQDRCTKRVKKWVEKNEKKKNLH